MLKKLVALFIVFGVVAAENLEQKTFSTSNNVVHTDAGYEVVQVTKPDYSRIIDAICSLIGYKASALTIAVTAIEWIISNFFVILLGTASALGFCMVTGKCSLNYEQYIPVTQFEGLVTPENMETAEKFLVTAVEKYAEKKRST